MTTKKLKPRELEVFLSLKLAEKLDLPPDFHETLVLLRKQTPIVRYIRMASIVGDLIIHLKNTNPTDREVHILYNNHVSETSDNLKHYIMTGDIKGLNEINKEIEDHISEVFDEQTI